LPADGRAHFRQVLDPDFLGSIWETAKAFFLALLIAWSSGVVIGIVLGAHRLTGEVAGLHRHDI